MKATNQFIKSIVITLFILALLSFHSFGQHHALIPTDGNIYVNPEIGNNDNSGSSESPIKSLYEAAQRLNNANGKGAITIFLSEGIHGLDATVTFHPVNWHFTKEARLSPAKFFTFFRSIDPFPMPFCLHALTIKCFH